MRKKERQQNRKFDVQEFTDICHTLQLLNDMDTLCQYYDMVELYETLQNKSGFTKVKIFVNQILTKSLGETVFSIEFIIDALSDKKILIHTKLDNHQRKFIFYAGNFVELLGIAKESYLCVVLNDLETVMTHINLLSENYISYLFQLMQFNVQQDKKYSYNEAYQYMIEVKTQFLNKRLTRVVYEIMEDLMLQKKESLCVNAELSNDTYPKWEVEIKRSIQQAFLMYLSMCEHGYEAKMMKEILSCLIYNKEQQQLLMNHRQELNESTISKLHNKVEKVLQKEHEAWRAFYLKNHLDIDEKLLLRFDVV